jgi:hypothetical protein
MEWAVVRSVAKLKKWTLWAAKLNKVRDPFIWVLVLSFRGVNYQDAKILVQTKLLYLVDNFLFILLYDIKIFHARDAVKFLEQIFLLLSFEHVCIFQLFSMDSFLYNWKFLNGNVFPGVAQSIERPAP